MIVGAGAVANLEALRGLEVLSFSGSWTCEFSSCISRHLPVKPGQLEYSTYTGFENPSLHVQDHLWGQLSPS